MTADPSPQDASDEPLRLAIPKGRMLDGVVDLLREAGVPLRLPDRGYRPSIELDGFRVKLLKPQNIVEMLHAGSRDLGFAGFDWVVEKLGRDAIGTPGESFGESVEVIELEDTHLDPVRIVAAAPADLLEGGRLPDRPLTIASEYEAITRGWIESRGLDARFVRTYGATEVFPPEDADVVVDNTATGATLRANGLRIFEEVLRSSTRLYASRRAYEEPRTRARIDHLQLLVKSVLNARSRVMLELNVESSNLDEVIERLPTMRRATVSPLHCSEGFAVKAAVPRGVLAELIPSLRAAGGMDLVVTEIAQLVE